MLYLSEETLLLGPPSHLHVTYGTLNLTLSLLFIHPQTNQRPWTKPKAEYTILGPYPTIAPQNSDFSLLSEEKKYDFDFLELKPFISLVHTHGITVLCVS